LLRPGQAIHRYSRAPLPISSRTGSSAASWASVTGDLGPCVANMFALTECLDFEVFEPRQFFAAGDNCRFSGAPSRASRDGQKIRQQGICPGDRFADDWRVFDHRAALGYFRETEYEVLNGSASLVERCEMGVKAAQLRDRTEPI
jgi:hypothetical protein